MSVQLLDKTRKINKLLHNNNSSKVVFNDICAVLTEILDSNVLVVSKKGKILGVSKSNKVREISELITESVGSHIDNMLNERLLSVLSTKENVNLETLGFSFRCCGRMSGNHHTNRYCRGASRNIVYLQTGCNVFY